MGKSITSLSAGLAVNGALKAALGDKVTGIYPVASPENAAMPFVVYYRTGVRDNPTKGSNGFDTCTMEISVFTADYASGVGLIEAVRAAVEGRLIIYTDDADPEARLRVDCGRVADCGEWFGQDTYRQDITIECKIL